ncbi:MAG: sigma-70 family RNA polymerase sigma factor [Saprospiraceae bacterium]|nr:sigma-70 family RNA polymerase sigma factor [Saprospiraceae bacterium]
MNLADCFQRIQKSSTERNELLVSIHNNLQLRNAIKSYLKSKGATDIELDHLYNETLVALIKTGFATQNVLNLSGDLEPYLMGIARNLWYQECKKRKREISLPEVISHQTADDQPVAEEIFLTKERYSLLHNVLDKLRSNCRAVLMHWANGFSMTEIAEKLGYQSEGMARKKKSQCLAELNDFLFQNPQIKLQLQ